VSPSTISVAWHLAVPAGDRRVDVGASPFHASATCGTRPSPTSESIIAAARSRRGAVGATLDERETARGRDFWSETTDIAPVDRPQILPDG
jgi:hypothetical protein